MNRPPWKTILVALTGVAVGAGLAGLQVRGNVPTGQDQTLSGLNCVIYAQNYGKVQHE